MKVFLKKYNIHFLFVFLFLIIYINAFLHTVAPYDELWNFQTIYKMFNNYTIYIDFNVIITPLFFIFGNILFNMFGATISIFRSYNMFIYTFQYILVFYIFKTLKINKNLAFLYLSLIISQFYSIIPNGANYNSLAICFILIGVIIYLNYYNKKIYNFYQGILIFLIFFTKQNLGVYYAIGILLFELFDKKFSKLFIFNQLQKFFYFIIPMILSFFIMYKKGILLDFINYIFGGILEFGNSNTYINYHIFLFLFIINVLSGLYLVSIKTENLLSKDQKRNSMFLFVLAICISFVILPIVNRAHLAFAYLLIYITFFYILDIIFIRHIISDKTDTIWNLCSFIILLVLLLRILSILYTNLELFNKFDKTHPFYNAPFEEDTLEKINAVSDYIKEKNKNGIDVIIIASDSAYIMIPLNQNHGDFDLVNEGNFGYNGLSKMLYQIENSENTEFLIYTDEKDVFWQEPKEIRACIINSLEKIGEIEHYSIYSK